MVVVVSTIFPIYTPRYTCASLRYAHPRAWIQFNKLIGYAGNSGIGGDDDDM